MFTRKYPDGTTVTITGKDYQGYSRDSAGTMTTITGFDADDNSYKTSINGYWYPISSLTVRETWDHLIVGETILENEDEPDYLVTGQLGENVFVRYAYDEANDANIYSIGYLKSSGWTIKDQTPTEKIKIGEHSYDKAEVEKRLEGLKEV